MCHNEGWRGYSKPYACGLVQRTDPASETWTQSHGQTCPCDCVCVPKILELVSASGAFDMGKFWRVLIGMFDSASGLEHRADDHPAD